MIFSRLLSFFGLAILGIHAVALPTEPASDPIPATSSVYPTINGDLPAETVQDFARLSLRCETTAASPSISDYKNLIRQFAKRPSNAQCMQKTKLASFCTELDNYGGRHGASVSICGGVGQTVRCVDVAFWIQFMIAHCSGRGAGAGKMGGILYLNGKRLAFH
ncbi:hypothetical protein EDC01DRAFT_626124 [Geopyxis carbonaria]|nr:hypothetical protein EDC01DRAFT_626124 [Geopyxis carbonaria]